MATALLSRPPASSPLGVRTRSRPWPGPVTLDVPVLSVIIRPDWPTTGPLTEGVRLGRIVEALQKRTGG